MARSRGTVPLGAALAPPRWGRAGWVIAGVVLLLVIAAAVALRGVPTQRTPAAAGGARATTPVPSPAAPAT